MQSWEVPQGMAKASLNAQGASSYLGYKDSGGNVFFGQRLGSDESWEGGNGRYMSGTATVYTQGPRGVIASQRNLYKKMPTPAAGRPPADQSKAKPDDKPVPPPKLDIGRIEAAKKAAEPYVTAYNNAKPPSFFSQNEGGGSGSTTTGTAGGGIDPYRAANQFGLDANAYFSKLTDRNDAVAKQQASEMGAALNFQMNRFMGAVPKLKDWREYYDPLKSDILSA